MTAIAPGHLLRDWRVRRRYSQMSLAHAAEVSTKHVSYIETGRTKPSPEMILHLCEHLEVPLRHRNEILLAAGFAPRYGESRYESEPDGALRDAVERVVAAHAVPAVVVDCDWNLVTANAAAQIFLTDVAPRLLVPPINVVRMSLDPEGLAGRVTNFDVYAAHILTRVRRLAVRAPSATLEGLLTEFAHLEHAGSTPVDPGLLLPLGIRTPHGEVRLFSTITTFGSPLDATLEELAIETFWPADAESAERLDQLG